MLIVLTGSPTGRGAPAALVRRAADLRALAAADPRLRRAAGRLRAGVTTLQQLQDHGLWAAVVVPVFGDDPKPVHTLSFTHGPTWPDRAW